MPFGQLHRTPTAPATPARPGGSWLKTHQKQAAAGGAVLGVVVLALRHKKNPTGAAPVDTTGASAFAPASAGQVAYPGSSSADTAGGGGYGYTGPTSSLPGANGPTDASNGTGAPAPVINVTVNNPGAPTKKPVPGAPKKPAAPAHKPTAAEVARHRQLMIDTARHQAAAAAAAKKPTAGKLPGATGPRR